MPSRHTTHGNACRKGRFQNERDGDFSLIWMVNATALIVRYLERQAYGESDKRFGRYTAKWHSSHNPT
jgi:hypothetical protein